MYGQAPLPSLATHAQKSGIEQLPETQLQPNQPHHLNQPQQLSPSSQNSDASQGAPASQPGNISGTVTDEAGDAVSGATVVLQGTGLGDRQTVTTNVNGFFEISNVRPAVPYHIIIKAGGFANWTSPVIVLKPGEFKILAGSRLRIQQVQTNITVTPETAIQIATAQVEVEENQRGFGVIPNFYAVYVPDPEPLTPRLKFDLAFKLVRDPITAGSVALLAGVGQATGTPSYDGGVEGFGQRTAAIYANQFTDIMIGGAVLPSLLHQDPRYFYQGSGSTFSRMVHVISSVVIAKGDNGQWQPNYSNIGGDLASAAISNAYYPASDRGATLFLENFAIDTGVHVGVRLLEEFVFRPSK